MSIFDKVMNKASERAAALGTSLRSDIRITDYVKIGDTNNTVKVLMQYDSRNPTPTLREVDQWFASKCGTRIHAKLETAQAFHEQPIMTIFASGVQSIRPITDADNMVRLGLSSYQDGGTGTIWDVSEDESGVKKLIARSADDLGEIFERLVQRSYDRKTASKLDQISRTASHVYGVGDVVKFVDRDLVGRGEVLECGGTTCKVKYNGQELVLSKGQIVDVVRRSQMNTNNERNQLQQYWSQVYGEDYASKFTQTLNKDVTGPNAQCTTTGPMKY